MDNLEKWRGKVAVVTGASGGIGLAIVKRLIQSDIRVVGLARNKEKVLEYAATLNGKRHLVYAVSADVSNEEDMLSAFKWIKEEVGPIHILVNCAGVMRLTSLHEGCTKSWQDVLYTNVLGLCIATREAIKSMRENECAGQVIHINSTAGHTAYNMNMYSPSKFAVTALTETLRQELNSNHSKIKITGISPGLVDTNLFHNSAKESGLVETPNRLASYLQRAPQLKASDIADAVGYVLSTPPQVQVHELIIKPVGERT